MSSKKSIILITICFLTLTICIVSGTYYYITKKQENLLNSIYYSTNKNILKLTKSFLDDKENTTLSIALALSKDNELHKKLATHNYSNLDYKSISEQFRISTKFKTIWIQIIDKEGVSVYRSWTNKKGDSLLFRKDLKDFMEKKRISTLISIGLYSMAIKSRVPIIDNENNFLGAIEVISQFNSIANNLKENNIDSIIIVDKKYKETIKFPYSQTFIDDYYIANINMNKDLINYLIKNNIEKYINMDSYIIENNYLISKYNLYNEKSEQLGYILYFVKLSDIDFQIVESFKIQTVMSSVIILIVLFFTFLIYLYTNYLRQLKIEENKKQSILNSQQNIIVITNGKTLIDANQRLYDFFTDTKDLITFKEKYECICSSFIDMNDEIYLIEKFYDGKTWAEYVLLNQDKHFRVAIKNKDDEIKHFSVRCSKISDEEFIIATFTDITQEIAYIEANKDKDRIVFQQSKIAAIADTLKNIAHQWRQPLSVISTIASGMKIQKELNILEDVDFIESCDAIIDNTNKLSYTIENFTDFFNKEDSITRFSLIETMENIKKFMDFIFQENGIKCFLSYDTDIILHCNKNDFSQAILNILDNSMYALINNQTIGNRFIFIELNNHILQIKDSGKGIDENLISKIFEPYFTTKHQAFGVGLGLYIVNEILVNTIGYKIGVQNIDFTFENKTYTGTNFVINFN
jgi:signal transduction histidine kinase